MTKPTITSLSERVFTYSARLLTDESVEVKIGDFPHYPACAWWEHDSKRVFLNDAAPRTQDPVENLIFNRGKLYHELAHKLFTNAYDYRNECAAKAKDPQLFDGIRQTLEDGYIEWRIGKQWEGATPYIRSLLSHVLKNDTSDIGALALFVRLLKWRDKAAKAKWCQFEKQIVAAIHSDSRGVSKAALDISNALAEEKPKQPEQPQDPQDGEQGESASQGEGEQEGEGEQGEGAIEEGEGEESEASGGLGAGNDGAKRDGS